MIQQFKSMNDLVEYQDRLASPQELQSETQEELDALLPSVLDKAFQGEL